MPVWLSEADVRRVLHMPAVIEQMEAALRAFSTGEVDQPLRGIVQVRPGSFFGSMPAYVRTVPALGAKLVTVFPENARVPLPTHQAVILLFAPETGTLRAVIDGRYITEVRTAAVSAVAVRHLTTKNVRVLAILGSGVQARSHLEALPLVRDLQEARVWSPTAAHLEALIHEHPGGFVRAAKSAEEAVSGADIVVLVTSSVIPVLDHRWVKPGACVIGVGACRPDQREIDPQLVAGARLVVDSRKSALSESGDVVLGIREGRFTADHIAAELGEIIAGLTAASENQTTVFKSLGLAVEDVTAAALAFSAACEAGIGVQLD